MKNSNDGNAQVKLRQYGDHWLIVARKDDEEWEAPWRAMGEQVRWRPYRVPPTWPAIRAHAIVWTIFLIVLIVISKGVN